MTYTFTQTRRSFATVLASFILMAFAVYTGTDQPNSSNEPDSIDLAFVTHLDMDLPEQDVYIERVPGSGNVYRVTKGDHNMNAPLYKTAEENPHDPFNPDAIGPYEKGEPLGMTLGQWLKHGGTGTYTCENGVG